MPHTGLHDHPAAAEIASTSPPNSVVMVGRADRVLNGDVRREEEEEEETEWLTRTGKSGATPARLKPHMLHASCLLAAQNCTFAAFDLLDIRHHPEYNAADSLHTPLLRVAAHVADAQGSLTCTLGSYHLRFTHISKMA